ncbi:2OG-Fe(II) oxygenase family protein [Erythrobacter sanguineus]|uniref:2OG-Fe(II) oxygenase family protein n=1 Tax=Erythrobacter sanguineus TaxID=198312 RepID=UPI0015BBC86F|nr:putative 2OG-Fe(II) oxygenase [Erythrobacter sanguineus]
MRDRDDPEGAVTVLETALGRHPDEAILWQCLGLVHRALLDSEPAIAALQKAARLRPQDGKIMQALAHVTLEAGLPATAIFDQARALMPQDGSVLIGRSAAQLAEGDVNAAIGDIEAVCETSPLWLEGHRALADLKWLVGQQEEFVSSYKIALARDPGSLPLWLNLLDRYQRVERFDWAAQALSAAYDALGERDELAPIAAICASELGNQVEADALFARLLSQPHHLQDIDLLVRAVRHLVRTNRPSQAVTLAAHGLESPEANKLWPYVATAWRMMDDPQWHWLEGDERLVNRIQLYEPQELIGISRTLRSLHRMAHQPAGQSVRIGSQTDGPLFARIEPEIRDLRRRIEQAVRSHIASLGPEDPRHPVLHRRPPKVRFAGSWSVRLQGAGHHSNHVHPQGWLSSALYIAVPADAESGPPPAGHLQLGVPPAELGIDLPPIRVVAPEPGWLTLFPSTMWHGTVPIADGERMTVAFDVKG